MKDINIEWGKVEDPRTGKRISYEKTKDKKTKQWTKRSIFFEIPYWEFNELRHNLDVMHIEKNVCDNNLYTLINDGVKSKDHLVPCQDLEELNIKKDLWPNENGKCVDALVTLAKQEVETMLQILKSLSVLDGYSSNISRCVDLV